MIVVKIEVNIRKDAVKEGFLEIYTHKVEPRAQSCSSRNK